MAAVTPMSPHDLVVEAKSRIKEVPTAEAQALLGKRVVIDVREYDEFAAWNTEQRPSEKPEPINFE